MTSNAEVADRFEELADFLEARDVDYKPELYRTTAANVRSYPEAVERLADAEPERLQRIEGVGESTAEKIVEFVETGSIAELEEERAALPVDMPALTAVEGVGPKTVATLHDALGIRTLDDLEAAAEAGEIREVRGFGEKSERNILEAVAFAREAGERQLLGDARPLAEEAVAYLAAGEPVGRCSTCGSLRRWRETIGDVDVLAEAANGADDLRAVVDAFVDWERADEVIEAGSNKASLRVDGVRVDLRAVVPAEFGSALQYFTGSREHNIRLRNYAIERGQKVNEYGVFDVSDVEDPDAGQRVGERVAGATEDGVYAALDLPSIPPELREDAGEIDAARRGTLPDLVTVEAIRGDLHAHTEWSDGNESIADLVAAAEAFGHDYLCISDHAAGPGMVGGVGLSDDDLREQIEAVRAVAADADVEVFAGVEANVDADGALSTGDDVLAALDLVIASPHSGLDAGGDATERLVRAVEHPQVDVIGHPTGRLINRRSGLDVDVGRLAEAAADEGVALEVNANSHRLDLNGGGVRTAIESGATIAINTDAHGPREFENVVYGVHTARRGWAEDGDVLNARDADGLREFLD